MVMSAIAGSESSGKRGKERCRVVQSWDGNNLSALIDKESNVNGAVRIVSCSSTFLALPLRPFSVLFSPPHNTRTSVC